MARAKTPFPISGKIGDLVLKVQNGKQTIQKAPGKQQGKKGGPASKQNRQEFAGAAKIAQAIYRAIKADQFEQRKPHLNHDKLGPIFRPYAQNYLTARIKTKADDGNKRRTGGLWFASEFYFYDAVKALKGLDLSDQGSPSGHVSMTPWGPRHNPTDIKVQGLEHAARTIDKHGNATLQLRFHIRQARVRELTTYDETTKEWKEPAEMDNRPHATRNRYASEPTAWIPVEFIPREGITLPLPTDQWHSDDKYLTAVMVEWREIRTVGRRAIRLHQHGIVRIAAMHAPEEAWIAPDRPFAGAEKNPLVTKPKPSPQLTPHTDPENYLQQALAMLHPKAPE